LLKRRVALLRELLAANGRAPEEAKIVHGAAVLVPRDTADVLAYSDAGVSQMVVSLSPGEPADRDRQLIELAERVLG
jgi:alkanesulfonate monooxygenase SsuD/methylene tetrahydromethanopterin reductase-like flavin-dependent oxidoreductase (luciferase family)